MANEVEILATATYCDLTTTGRVTGQPRTVELWFALDGATAYALAGNGDRTDWVKNAQRQPQVTVRIGDRLFEGHARSIRDADEDALARRLLFEKYSPTSDDLIEWARTALPLAFDLVLPAGRGTRG